MADRGTEIRYGRVTEIDYENARARVTWQDRDHSVSSFMPFAANQYSMPVIDDLVAVQCTSNGTVAGFILWTVYNNNVTPREGHEGLWRQEMFNPEWGKAYHEYDDVTELHALKAPKDLTTTKEELAELEEGEIREETETVIRMDAGKLIELKVGGTLVKITDGLITVSGAKVVVEEEVFSEGICLPHHIHPAVAPPSGNAC